MRGGALVLVCFAFACALRAPDETKTSSASSPIVGGSDVGVCAWPSVVALESETGICTGALIHPELVLFAAHCMSNGEPSPFRATFGESLGAPAFSVPVTTCKADPKFPGQPSIGKGHDLAFCRLQHAVNDVPIVPVLTRCEAGELEVGLELTAVGFGDATKEGTGGGIKRAVALPVVELVDDEAFVGGDGKGTCGGDSGGPMFLRISSGETRIAGVTSYAPGSCGLGEYLALVARGYDWLANASAVDLTRVSALHPELANGAWPSACGDGVFSDTKADCAPQHDATPTDDAGCSISHTRTSSFASCAFIVAFILSGRRPERVRRKLRNPPRS